MVLKSSSQLTGKQGQQDYYRRFIKLENNINMASESKWKMVKWETRISKHN